MMKGTQSLLVGAALLVAAAGSAAAQDCVDYAGTTRWAGEKTFEGLWTEEPQGRCLAHDGGTVVACDPYGQLTIFDATRPDDLTIVGGRSFLSAVRSIVGIALRGSILYAAQPHDSLLVVSIADPARPARLGGYALLPDRARLACRDTWLYAAGGTTLRVLDAADPSAPGLVGELALPAAAVDLAVSGSLVVVATAEGLLTIDVADPRAPRLRGVCNDAGATVTAVAIEGPYAYLANHDLVVVDLSDPDVPRCVGRAIGGGGLAIAVENGWAVTTGTIGSGVRTLDVSVPTQPRLIGRTGFVMLPHHGVTLHEGYAFTIANDLTRSFLPHPDLVAYRLGAAAPPPVTISHPWPESYGWEVFGYWSNVDGDHLRCLTSTWVNGTGTVYRLDVLELHWPADAALVGSVEVHGGRVGWQGSRAFVAGNALELLDLSDPAQPRITATVPLPASAAGKVSGVLICDPLVLLVTDDAAVGVVAVDARDPAAPFIVASGPSPLVGKRTVVRGGLGYAATHDSLFVLDLGDPARATVVNAFASGGDLWDDGLIIANDHLWLVGSSSIGDSELRGYSLADPLSPAPISRCRTPADGSRLTAADNLLLLSDVRGTYAMDVSDPGHPSCAGMVCDASLNSVARWNERALIVGEGAIAFAPLPCAAAVPVFLASFAAAAAEGGVGICWTVGAAAAGEFHLSASRGEQSWTVLFTSASGEFSARDGAPLLAAGGTVDYTLGYRASQADPWQVIAQQSVTLDAPARPVTFLAPHPNPFNPVVRIPFVLARAQRARVVVYDLAGRRVATLADEVFDAGRQELVWRGLDAWGVAVASGSYVVRVEGESGRDVGRLMLLR